jgi:hypothetical protein
MLCFCVQHELHANCFQEMTHIQHNLYKEWLTRYLAYTNVQVTASGKLSQYQVKWSTFTVTDVTPPTNTKVYCHYYLISLSKFQTPLYCQILTNYYIVKFDIPVTVHCVKFLIINPTRCTNFSNFFLEWNSTCFRQFLHPSSGVFHCTHSNGICHTGLLCVQYSDDEWRNCPKHVEFHSKNKFEKLVHLVGFIKRNTISSITDNNVIFIIISLIICRYNFI